MTSILKNRVICPECEGKRIEVPVNMMTLATHTFTSTILTSWACLACGYTSFYVQNLESLRKSSYNR